MRLSPCRNRPRNVGRDHRRDLAFGQHVVEPLARRDHLDLEIVGLLERDVLLALDHPGDRLVRHAVMLLQDAAHPEIAGRLEIGAADALADQVLRLADAGIGVDEDEAVAEAAMQEHRQRGERLALVARHEIGADIELADDRTRCARAMRQCRSREPMPVSTIEFDAVDLDQPFLERLDDLVVAGGKGQFQLRHRARSRRQSRQRAKCISARRTISLSTIAIAASTEIRPSSLSGSKFCVNSV